MPRPLTIVLIGPTSTPYEEIAHEVEADLARLARPGLALSYRCTGAGPASITTDDDARAAAPHVIEAIVAASAAGADGVIVDCTEDPGVADARRLVAIPVVGAGEALREALAGAPEPVVVLGGDDLRRLDQSVVLERVRGAATVALDATGWSHLADVLTADGRVVLDPLPVAMDRLLALLDHR